METDNNELLLVSLMEKRQEVLGMRRIFYQWTFLCSVLAVIVNGEIENRGNMTNSDFVDYMLQV